MKPETTSLADIAEALASIQSRMAEMGGELARMNERLAAAEAAQAAQAAELGRLKLNDELIFVISAAIAAFLGKKAHIRHVHLLGSASWSRQGRVTIQASHALNPSRSQP